MDINRYNTKVRQAMSDNYVRTSKEKAKLKNELLMVSQQLTSEETKSTMIYEDYMELKKKEETIQKEIYRLSIEHKIWDEARELCMDIADERQ